MVTVGSKGNTGGCDQCSCDCNDDSLPFYGIRLKRPSEQIPAKAIFVQDGDDYEQVHCYTLLGYHPALHGMVQEEEEFRLFKVAKWTVPESDLVGSTIPYKSAHEYEEEEWDYFMYAPVSTTDLIQPALLQSAYVIPLTIDESGLTEDQFFHQDDEDYEDEDYDPEDSNGEEYYTNDYPDSYCCEDCSEECDCDEYGKYDADEYDENSYDEYYDDEDDEGEYGDVDILGEHLAKFKIEVDDDGKCPHSLYIEYCDECLGQQEKLYELREQLAHQMHAHKVLRQLSRQMGRHNDDEVSPNIDGRIQEVRDECEARESGRVYHTPYGRHAEPDESEKEEYYDDE